MKSISQFQFQKFIFTILLLLAFNSLIAQQKPSWQWARSLSYYSAPYVINTTVDKSGNLYFTGAFGSYLNIDTSTFSGFDRTAFVAKFDPLGNLIWVRHAINGYPYPYRRSEGISVKVDTAEDVYMAGNYFNTVIFGTDTLNSKGNSDFFLVKYDKYGNVVWVRTAGGTTRDGMYLDAMEVGNNGNVFLGGFFGDQSSSSPILGTIQFDTVILTSKGKFDVFIASYNANGDLRWAKSAGSEDFDAGFSLELDANNNVYVGGNYRDSISFDSIHLHSSGPVGIFIVKLDSSGNSIWAESIEVPHIDVFPFLALNSAGNLYVTGNLSAATLTIGQYQLFSVKNFLAKYDINGNLLWAKKIGDQNSYFSGITSDKSDDVYLAGSFKNKYVIANDTLSSKGGYDAVIAKYNKNGDGLWGLSSGGKFDDFCSDIILSSSGELFTAGIFDDTAKFGSIQLHAGFGGAFIAKLTQPNAIADLHSQKNNVVLFPNPTSGMLNIHCTDKSYSTAKLLDQLGREVLSQQLKEKQTSIHVDHLANGVYYLQLWNNNSSLTQKIIIQH